MSISVTATVAPSRRLRLLLAAFCACLLAAAWAVGVAFSTRFGSAAASLPLLAAGLAIGHACVACRAGSLASPRRIDISGPGTLRLTVQQNVRPPSLNSEPVTLLSGAIIWPCCMVLRLRAESGLVWRLVLLPDSVGPETYRALAVALRAVAAGVNKKIL